MTSVTCKVCRKNFAGPQALADHMLEHEAEDLGVVFEEPPKRHGAKKKYDFSEGAQKMLKARPDEWARILTLEGKSSASSVCARFRKEFGTYYEFKGGKYMENTSAIWAKYRRVVDRP